MPPAAAFFFGFAAALIIVGAVQLFRWIRWRSKRDDVLDSMARVRVELWNLHSLFRLGVKVDRRARSQMTELERAAHAVKVVWRRLSSRR